LRNPSPDAAGVLQNGHPRQNIALEFRFAYGKPDALASLAAELVRQDTDVIVADGGQAALAANRATQKIPIVMGAVGDPVKLGL
jgi:ABC-type uncharacterized transport system substrate-binding protein